MERGGGQSAAPFRFRAHLGPASHQMSDNTDRNAKSSRLRRGALGLLVALLAASGALAYFTASGSGAVAGSAGALPAPTVTSTSAGAGTATISWSTVTPPSGATAVQYYVTRNGGAPAGNCPTAAAPSSVTTCTDSGLSAGTYSYTVTAVWLSWTATSATASVPVSSGAANHFTVVAVPSATAGSPFSVTVTPKDAANNTVVAYRGTVQFSSTDAQAALPANYTFTAADNGSHTFTSGVTLKTAGSQTVTVSDTAQPSATGSASVNVTPAAAASLSLSAATASPTAGSGDSLTITAHDQYGNVATGYSGSKSLTFTGAHAIGSSTPSVTNSSGTAVAFGSTTAISFASGVASVSGSSNGTMTLYKAESPSITVTDGTISNSTSPLTVTVAPATASSFTVPTPAGQTSGTAFNETLTALDAYGNTATGYSGSEAITFSGPANSPNNTAPGYPANVSFTNGAGTASITLYDAQSTVLTATQGTITGTSGSFTVAPLSTTAALSVSGFPSPAVSGTANNFTVAAVDTYGNTTPGYTGTVQFSTTCNTGATLPGNYTFIGSGTGKDNGTHTFSATLKQAGTCTLTATQGTNTGSQTGIISTASQFVLSAASNNPTAGAADNLTITAKDANNNTATNYTGNHSLTFSGASTIGTFGPTVTNSSGTAVAFGTGETIGFSSGVATVSSGSNGAMTLYQAGTSSIAVTDGTISNGSGLSITVGAASASKLAFTQQAAGAYPGTAFGTQPVVSVEDAYGNPTTSNATVTVAITGGTGTPGAILGCTTNPLATISGVATFSGCKISGAGTGYTLTATAAGLSAGTSSSFNVATSTATVLAGLTDTVANTLTETATASTTSGATELILVARSSQAGDSISFPTNGNTAFSSTPTLVTSIPAPGTGGTTGYLWIYEAKGSGTALGTVTADFAKGNGATFFQVIQLASGVSVNQSTSNVGAGSTPSVGTWTTTPPSGDSELVLIGAQPEESTLTPPAGQAWSGALTSLLSGAGGGVTIGTFYTSTAQASSTFTLSGSATEWGTIALDLG